MSADTAHLMAAGLFLLPALVWSILAYHFWEIIRARPALRHPALLSLRGVVLVAVVVWIGVLQQLLPAALRDLPGAIPRLLVASQDTAAVILLALFRHATWYSSFRAEQPTRAWLARNYGACAAVALVVVAGNLGVLRGPWVTPIAVATVGTYEGLMLILIARRKLWIMEPVTPAGHRSATWRRGQTGDGQRRASGAQADIQHRCGDPQRFRYRPFVPMLAEENTREGFLEPADFATLCAHRPSDLADLAGFVYLTGWRKGQVLGLEWRHVTLECTRGGVIASGTVRRRAAHGKNKPHAWSRSAANSSTCSSAWSPGAVSIARGFSSRTCARVQSTDAAGALHRGDGCGAAAVGADDGGGTERVGATCLHISRGFLMGRHCRGSRYGSAPQCRWGGVGWRAAGCQCTGKPRTAAAGACAPPVRARRPRTPPPVIPRASPRLVPPRR